MKCSRCDFKNKKNANFCEKCGNNLKFNNVSSRERTLFGIMSFFFPIIGIIVGIVYSKIDKKVSKTAFICSVVSFCLIVLLVILLFFIFTFLLIGSVDSGKSYSCSVICGGEYESVTSDKCICYDGLIYDYNTGEYINEDDNHGDNDYDNEEDDYKDEERIIIRETSNNINITSWINDINSGKEVVTVIGSSTCPHCIAYKPVIERIAKKNNIKLYFFEANLLDSSDKNIITDIDSDKFSFSGSVPFTYIIRDNKYIADTVGYSDIDSIIYFLNNNGFNINSDYSYENDSI